MELKDYLSKLLDSLLLDGFNLEIIEDEDKTLINLQVSSEDSGILIGRKGDVLISLQRLLRVVFADELGDKKLLLNINDYRDSREEKVREMAYRAADRVISSGRRYTMRGLNSVERFIIHNTINQDEKLSELTSYSQGQGPDRVLIIEFKHD